MSKKDTKSEVTVQVADTTSITTDSGIVVNDHILRPQILPLIVTLPSDASKAQIERAKVLNAYAYSNPKGWGLKKDRLIQELEELKNAPDPVTPNEDSVRLSVGSRMPGVLPE